MNGLFEILTTVVSWIGLYAPIYRFFPMLESRLRKESRIALSSWLKGSIDLSKDWVTVFLELFDSLFRVKSRFLPLPSLLRSCVASLAAVLFCVLILIVVMPEGISIEVSPFQFGSAENWFASGHVIISSEKGVHTSISLVQVILLPFMNLIPDYISLTQSRFLISLISRFKNRLTRFVLFVIDGLLTFAVTWFSFVYLIAIPLSFPTSPSFCISYTAALDFQKRMFFDNLYFWDSPELSVLSIFIYSTFLTSVWLWLFWISKYIIKSLSLIPFFIKLSDRYFDINNDIDKHPLRVMGYALMIVGTIIILLL